MVFKFGITGGIASGKNTAVSILEKFAKESNMSFHHHDLDYIAKNTYCTPKSPAYSSVLNIFSNSILQHDQKINTTKLGDLVFSDPLKREKLEQTVYPYIKDYFLEKFKKPGMHCLNAALFIEKNWMDFVDNRIVLISVRPEVQFKRIKKRNPELSDEDITKRLQSQLPDYEKIRKVKELEEKGYNPYIITNNSSEDILRKELSFIWSALVKEYEHSELGKL